MKTEQEQDRLAATLAKQEAKDKEWEAEFGSYIWLEDEPCLLIAPTSLEVVRQRYPSFDRRFVMTPENDFLTADLVKALTRIHPNGESSPDADCVHKNLRELKKRLSQSGLLRFTYVTPHENPVLGIGHLGPHGHYLVYKDTAVSPLYSAIEQNSSLVGGFCLSDDVTKVELSRLDPEEITVLKEKMKSWKS